MTGLPPRVGDIVNGSVTWERIEGVDFELLGYFLSCHLVVEHYLDEYLKAAYPRLCWAKAKHTFSQKVSLLSDFKVSERYDCIPAIKHMNAVRNKLGHRIAFEITPDELLPLVQYLNKATEGEMGTPSDARGILQSFTSMTCVLFAAGISSLSSLDKTDSAMHAAMRRHLPLNMPDE